MNLLNLLLKSLFFVYCATHVSCIFLIFLEKTGNSYSRPVVGIDAYFMRQSIKPDNNIVKAQAAIRSVKNTIAGCLGLSLVSGTVFAASLGMVTDNQSDELRLFDAATGVIVASLQGSVGQITGDCALSEDESMGFSSNAARQISVFQFTNSDSGKSIDFSSIEISNAGVDMSLSPDGNLLISTGAGNTYEPLSIIDIAGQVELATSAPFIDHTSAEFCDDGTLLLTTTYGNSLAAPFDNAMYDARVSPEGELLLGGNRLSSGAQPNNGNCAPGSKSGVLLDRESGLTSFTLPGLEKADFASLNGATAVAAVFNRSGDRLYVRTTEAVEAFDFNPFTGMMQADWVQPVSFSAEYFGIDQIAIDPDSGKLYVDGGKTLLILDPEDGRQMGSVLTGDATGVCFAQRQPHSPVLEVVLNEF